MSEPELLDDSIRDVMATFTAFVGQDVAQIDCIAGLLDDHPPMDTIITLLGLSSFLLDQLAEAAGVTPQQLWQQLATGYAARMNGAADA